MRFKKTALFICLIGLLVMGSMLTGFAATSTPRNQTMYVNGIQWGAPANFNMLTGNPAWPCSAQRLLVYESLFMYNQLSGGLEPLIGTSYKWADDYTLVVQLNKAAHFNDGHSLTSADVVYSYKLGQKYVISWSNYWTFLEDVVATAPYTVTIKLSKENYNRLYALDSLQNVPIHPKHIWEKIEKDANNNFTEIAKFFNAKPVASGPYKIFYYDDTRITVVRDDKYWGKAVFGKLPAPKYISHIIFKSNDAGTLAMKNGQVDMSQEFIPKVWNLWKDGAPVKTYLKEAPYYIPGCMPSIWFNLHKKGLDVPEVRRALAMAIDYKNISDIAMSGYSAKIEPALTLLTPSESKYVDKAAIKPYQWATDVDKANELLDSIGAQRGADGIRVLKDGTRLGPWDIECPYGWSDWNASLEIVMQCAKKIGIELRTKFPEAPVWTNDRQTGSFGIIMDTPANNQQPSLPWARARAVMYSKGVDEIGKMAYWNWGRYSNSRADEIIEQIPNKTDLAELKKLYTELTIIYLKDIPTIPLMYRPSMFYTVNEKVWKGFPMDEDGSNIPPSICMDGAGIRALYKISNK